MWIIRLFFLPSLHLTDSKRDVVTEIFVSPRNGLFSFFRVEATKRNACSCRCWVSIRPRACFSPSYNKVKSQTCFVWLLTLL